jgi:poly(3-hydroxybutyrate) depolymerase
MLLPPPNIPHDLQAALASFTSHRAAIERRLGADQAIDLGDRLVIDLKTLGDPMPDGYTPEAWKDTLTAVAQGDIEAIARAETWDKPQLTPEPGLHSAYAQSTIDGIWEPLAVYVPKNHSAHPPLAFVIHGRPQSEMEVLGQPYFRELADRTGTVLVAPWGRGSYDFEGAATNDLLALVPLAERTFNADPHHVYLVGYSMGGFTVFKVGTSSTWSGVMCIAGALLNSEVARVRFAWHDTPVYVVNGSQDASIPAVYGLQTAVFLDSLGVPTSFYQQPGGFHAIRTLMPQLEHAWDDMHHNVTRSDSIPRNTATAGFLPTAPHLQDADFKP